MAAIALFCLSIFISNYKVHKKCTKHKFKWACTQLKGKKKKNFNNFKRAVCRLQLSFMFINQSSSFCSLLVTQQTLIAIQLHTQVTQCTCTCVCVCIISLLLQLKLQFSVCAPDLEQKHFNKWNKWRLNFHMPYFNENQLTHTHTQ